MEKKQIQEVIQFAAEKEQEAVDFYQDIANKVNRQEVAEELLKIANMEKGHKERLERINLDDLRLLTAQKQTQNLQIADYIVDQEPHENMDWQDVIAIAMKRELAAMRLYQDLANLSADNTLKELFDNLAQEEGAHKNYFERLWDDKVLTDN